MLRRLDTETNIQIICLLFKPSLRFQDDNINTLMNETVSQRVKSLLNPRVHCVHRLRSEPCTTGTMSTSCPWYRTMPPLSCPSCSQHSIKIGQSSSEFYLILGQIDCSITFPTEGNQIYKIVIYCVSERTFDIPFYFGSGSPKGQKVPDPHLCFHAYEIRYWFYVLSLPSKMYLKM